MWTFAFLEQFAQDVRYALRAMAANPLFTATAVLSLALGIGANTAIYSFMDAILLRSLPVSHPEQLAVAEWHSPRRSPVVKSHQWNARTAMARAVRSAPISLTPPMRLLRADKEIFSTLFAYTYAQNFNVIAGGQAESIPGGFVSGNYFSGLGVPPAAGRLFDDADDRGGAPPTVVLSYAYWQRRFNGNPAVVGQSILVNNLPFTVAGVAAPGLFRRRSANQPRLLPADSRHADAGSRIQPTKSARASSTTISIGSK